MGKTLKIKNIKLKNFRGYNSLETNFHPKLNYIYGKNGSGKTNLIESIYFLTNLKSFRTKKRKSLIREGFDNMYIRGEFYNDTIDKEIKLEASFDQEKRAYRLNGKTEQNLINYLQSVNTTVFFPDSLRIVKDSPLLRRNFFDRAIASTDSSYLLECKEYLRILRERNKILKDKINYKLLEAWNERFLVCASRILKKRIIFMRLLERKLQPLKENLRIEKNIDIVYTKKFSFSEKENIEQKIFENIYEEYKKKKEEEKLKKQTCVGPHLDDFVIYFDEINARENSSQGEQRLCIILILLAVSDVCREISGENTIYLFDDMSSELDRERRQSVIEYLMSGNSQVFITTTEKPETKSPPESCSLFDLDSVKGFVH